MISELTNTAWSLLDEYYLEVEKNNFPEDSAKNLAATRIEQIRYGDEYKDYFWIINEKPEMIMHPYRPELIGTDLNNYKDPNGKLLFVEATKIVAENGEGFIDYMWQWKDDSTRIVPKLSYVKEFKPWEWIVGTGIYLEDVRQEISILQNRLLRVALLITLIISIILGFIIRQSLNIENKRKNAEKKLRLSRLKYKSLVDASTEGTLMILNKDIIYSNLMFSNLSGYDPFEIRNLDFGSLFDIDWETLKNEFDDPEKSLTRETILHCKDGTLKEVVISASMVSYSEQTGYIVIIKEVSTRQQFDRDIESLSAELQSSLVLMNQPLKPLAKDVWKCKASATIKEAAMLMARKNQNVILITQEESIIGILNDSDLKKRVLAEEVNPERPVIEIMTSPVITISENALLYEALLLMKEKNISHLATKDNNNNITGVVAYSDFADLQQNTISFLIREIESAEKTDNLVKLYNRLPVLVKALTDSGDKIENITRIISSVNDAIHQQVIHLAIEEIGIPPCEFAFMVMGSEGRKEQTLATDQDNAIIYEDLSGEKEETVRDYFMKFAEKINKDLNTIGYNYCRGEIMAKNPKWTQSLSGWKKYFTNWIQAGNPQDILEASIFFDFRHVYGEEKLVRDLRQHVNKTSENKSVFFYHMAQAIVKFKPPLNIFGNIVGNNSEADELNLDIKKGIFPVTAFIRLYAIREQLNETNSLERANRLYDQKIIERSIYEDLLQAYSFMTDLRLKSQVNNILQNETPDNMLDLNSLSRIEITTLKKILSEISELQTKVNFDFKGTE